MSRSQQMEPPQFQEASSCDVCKCSFGTFRRRHHCRCCGRSLCAEHSSDQMAIPQFGLHSNVRVCADCFNNASGFRKDNPPIASNGISVVTDQVSKLVISADSDSRTEQPSVTFPISGSLECKCGMPLCICEASPPPREATSTQGKIASAVVVSSNSKPKRTADSTSKSGGSTSNSKPGLIFHHGLTVNNDIDRPLLEYEASGEGLREAIKKGDTVGAQRLLSQGVDANYCDKQGSSLLHLAAVFNQTEIAFALMDNGARVDSKNSQGETPLDCAPAMLQYKMRSKMEASQNLGL